MALESYEGVTSYAPAEFADVGSEPTVEELLRYHACEQVLFAIHRLAEEDRLDEMYDLFTEDVRIDVDHLGADRASLHHEGKRAFREWNLTHQWLRKQWVPRYIGLTNILWRTLSPDVVRCRNWLFNFEFDPSHPWPTPPLDPRTFTDQIHEFHREDGKWRCNYRAYRFYHGPVSGTDHEG